MLGRALIDLKGGDSLEEIGLGDLFCFAIVYWVWYEQSCILVHTGVYQPGVWLRFCVGCFVFCRLLLQLHAPFPPRPASRAGQPAVDERPSARNAVSRVSLVACRPQTGCLGIVGVFGRRRAAQSGPTAHRLIAIGSGPDRMCSFRSSCCATKRLRAPAAGGSMGGIRPAAPATVQRSDLVF